MIIPAILTQRFSSVYTAMEQVNGIASCVQIDVCDGSMGPLKTWPVTAGSELDAILSENEGMPFWESIDIIFDCMAHPTPERIEQLIRLGPKRIIFHAKTVTPEFFNTLDSIFGTFVEYGIAFHIDDDPSGFSSIHPHMVQCMGIAHVGEQGNPFDERVFELIEKVQHVFPGTPIGVDGGVNEHSILSLKNVGVTEFVVGSAIFSNEYPTHALQKLQSMIE